MLRVNQLLDHCEGRHHPEELSGLIVMPQGLPDAIDPHGPNGES